MMDKRYPFILNMLLFSLAVLLSYLAGNVSKSREAAAKLQPEMAACQES